MLESKIQTSIVKYLKSKGYMVWKNIQISVNGFPDLTAVSPKGEHIYLEVKGPSGRLNEIQKYQIAAMQSKKLKVYVVTSVYEVKQIIEDGA